MSKEAVRRSVMETKQETEAKEATRQKAGADIVRLEKEREEAREAKEVREADVTQRRSFTELLGDVKQKTAQAQSASGDTSAPRTHTWPRMKSLERSSTDNIYLMWGRYMADRDAEVDELRHQVANQQEIIQKLEELVMSLRANVSKLSKIIDHQDEEIAELRKEQSAASEAMEMILDSWTRYDNPP